MKTNPRKRRIAFITIRYGRDIGGGAETLVKNYAETLSSSFDVEVLTTKATDHVTWKNEINADIEYLNNVKIHRFGVDQERLMDEKFLGMVNSLINDPTNIKLGEKFMYEQGPYSSSLLKYLKDNKKEYDYFVYCPYLYATTYYGIAITPKFKNIIIPAAHDEPFLHFKIMKNIFQRVSKVIFLTEEERDLVNRLYSFNYENKILGMGINIVKPDLKYLNNIVNMSPYVIYVGRIEEGKGVAELIEFFQRYQQESNSDIKLVLVGKSSMSIPDNPNIKYLGYLSESEKSAAIKGSEFLILSSQFESFSIVTLEAMKNSKAVLVNGKCEVLKGHCRKSNGGLWYEDYYSFKLAFDFLVGKKALRKEMGINGKRYVDLNYNKQKLDQKLIETFSIN